MHDKELATGTWDGEGTSIYFQEVLCCLGQVSKGASYMYWAGCWCTGWKECMVKLHNSVCCTVNIVSFIHMSICGWNILMCLLDILSVRCCSCLTFSLLSFSSSLLQNSMKRRSLLFMIWQVKLFHLTCGRFWSSYIRLVSKYFVTYR